MLWLLKVRPNSISTHSWSLVFWRLQLEFFFFFFYQQQLKQGPQFVLILLHVVVSQTPEFRLLVRQVSNGPNLQNANKINKPNYEYMIYQRCGNSNADMHQQLSKEHLVKSAVLITPAEQHTRVTFAFSPPSPTVTMRFSPRAPKSCWRSSSRPDTRWSSHLRASFGLTDTWRTNTLMSERATGSWAPGVSPPFLLFPFYSLSGGMCVCIESVIDCIWDPCSNTLITLSTLFTRKLLRSDCTHWLL